MTASGILVIPTRYVLSQDGMSVTGTVAVVVDDTFVFDLSGEVNGNFFSWEVPDSGCATFEGSGFNALGNLNPTTLSGNMVLDARPCGDRRFGGPATVDKISSSTGSQTGALSGRRGGDLDALRAQIERREKNAGALPPI